MRAMVVAGLMCVAGAAGADEGFMMFASGNDLHQHCKAHPALARGYIVGVVDYGSLARHLTSSGLGALCIPTEVTEIQIGDLACAYLENNPGRRHYSASWLVDKALQDAFPCPAE